MFTTIARDSQSGLFFARDVCFTPLEFYPILFSQFGMKSTMIAEKRCGESVSAVFTQYAQRLQQPLSLQYLARKAYLWQRPIGRECTDHVMCDGVECTLPHAIRMYLQATDYFLLRTHQM